MLIDEPPEGRRPVAVVPAGDDAALPALKLAEELRRAGFVVELGYSGNMRKRLQRANKANARVAVILGETELARGAAVLRDLDKGEQEEVPLAELADRLGTFY